MVGRRLHKHSHPGSNKRDIGMARFALAASRITDSGRDIFKFLNLSYIISREAKWFSK